MMQTPAKIDNNGPVDQNNHIKVGKRGRPRKYKRPANCPHKDRAEHGKDVCYVCSSKIANENRKRLMRTSIITDELADGGHGFQYPANNGIYFAKSSVGTVPIRIVRGPGGYIQATLAGDTVGPLNIIPRGIDHAQTLRVCTDPQSGYVFPTPIIHNQQQLLQQSQILQQQQQQHLLYQPANNNNNNGNIGNPNVNQNMYGVSQQQQQSGNVMPPQAQNVCGTIHQPNTTMNDGLLNATYHQQYALQNTNFANAVISNNTNTTNSNITHGFYEANPMLSDTMVVDQTYRISLGEQNNTNNSILDVNNTNIGSQFDNNSFLGSESSKANNNNEDNILNCSNSNIDSMIHSMQNPQLINGHGNDITKNGYYNDTQNYNNHNETNETNGGGFLVNTQQFNTTGSHDNNTTSSMVTTTMLQNASQMSQYRNVISNATSDPLHMQTNDSIFTKNTQVYYQSLENNDNMPKNVQVNQIDSFQLLGISHPKDRKNNNGLREAQPSIHFANDGNSDMIIEQSQNSVINKNLSNEDQTNIGESNVSNNTNVFDQYVDDNDKTAKIETTTTTIKKVTKKQRSRTTSQTKDNSKTQTRKNESKKSDKSKKQKTKSQVRRRKNSNNSKNGDDSDQTDTTRNESRPFIIDKIPNSIGDISYETNINNQFANNGGGMIFGDQNLHYNAYTNNNNNNRNNDYRFGMEYMFEQKQQNTIGEIVNFNVGGKFYSTLKTTLSNYKESILYQYIQDLSLCIVDQDGKIFIDKNHKPFSLILNYMRDQSMDIEKTLKSMNIDINEMLIESEYYNILSLITKLKTIIANKKEQEKKKTSKVDKSILEVIDKKIIDHSRREGLAAFSNDRETVATNRSGHTTYLLVCIFYMFMIISLLLLVFFYF